MTTSTIENREPGQATPTEKPEPPKKAKVAAPSPVLGPPRPNPKEIYPLAS